MRKKIIPIIVVTFIVVAGLLYLRQKKLSSSHNIKVSGNIEATDIRLSFQTPGRMVERLVDEGYYVKTGQVLARLDKNELTKIKEEAEAALKEAESNLEMKEKDHVRMDSLFKDNAVSAQERDMAKNNYEVARAELQAAKNALELAKIRLGYADLTSTVDGFVIVKSADIGEVLQVGSPVFTVVDLNDIWLTAYINETDLGRVKLNQSVDIKTDSYPDKIYKGRISFISQEAEFTPKQIQTTEERVKLVYRIKIDVDNPNLELKPGMPADGYIIE